MSVGELVVDVLPEQRDENDEDGVECDLRMELGIDLFERRLPIGWLYGKVPVRVARSEPIEGDPEKRIRITLAPVDEAASHPTFKLSRTDPH
jgi:hypothetical protein